MLGSVFDFNHDGSMNLGEAMSMGGIFGAYADEMMRESEKAERGASDSPWDDDDDDYDLYGSKKSSQDAVRESVCDFEDVDATSQKSVMKAIKDEGYDGDIETLVEEALDNGVRFKPNNIIRISYLIWDQELLVRLITTSKPRFLQEHADELAPHWGPVELEYHHEAFDEEDGNWNALLEEHEIARLHAGVCISSPETYSLDEKRRICERMDESTQAIDEAMRRDFDALPSFAKKMLLDMLGSLGTPEHEWWESILLDFESIPDAPPEG